MGSIEKFINNSNICIYTQIAYLFCRVCIAGSTHVVNARGFKHAVMRGGTIVLCSAVHVLYICIIRVSFAQTAKLFIK